MNSWERALRTDLLAPETLARIRETLRDGPIFGYMYRAHSGAGRYYWLAEDYEQFFDVLAGARARDHYEIWSLPGLVARGVALAAGRYDDMAVPGPNLFSSAALGVIADYLRDSQGEVFALFFGTARGPDVWVSDDSEYVIECAEWYNQPGGQGYVFPLITIESAAHALVEAVYPPIHR